MPAMQCTLMCMLFGRDHGAVYCSEKTLVQCTLMHMPFRKILVQCVHVVWKRPWCSILFRKDLGAVYTYAHAVQKDLGAVCTCCLEETMVQYIVQKRPWCSVHLCTCRSERSWCSVYMLFGKDLGAVCTYARVRKRPLCLLIGACAVNRTNTVFYNHKFCHWFSNWKRTFKQDLRKKVLFKV